MFSKRLIKKRGEGNLIDYYLNLDDYCDGFAWIEQTSMSSLLSAQTFFSMLVSANQTSWCRCHQVKAERLMDSAN
jgi:hypothetical protein